MVSCDALQAGALGRARCLGWATHEGDGGNVTGTGRIIADAAISPGFPSQ
jgi:hypothetical protein